MLITVGAIGSAASVQTPGFSIYQQLALWRFILGVGVGGEYPLSATITSETATPKLRGRLVRVPRRALKGGGDGPDSWFTARYTVVHRAVPAALPMSDVLHGAVPSLPCPLCPSHT